MPNRPDAAFRGQLSSPVIAAPRVLGNVPAYSVIDAPTPATPPPIDDDRDYSGNTPTEKAEYAQRVTDGDVTAWQLPDLTFNVPAGDNVLNIFGTWRLNKDTVNNPSGNVDGFVRGPIYKSFVDVLLESTDEEVLWDWKARLLVQTSSPILERVPSGGVDNWIGRYSFCTHDEWFHLPPIAEEAVCTVTFWLVRDLVEPGSLSGETIQRSHMCVLVTGTDPNAVPSNGVMFYDNDGVFGQNPPDVALEPFQ